MNRITSTALWGLMSLLAVLVGLASLRYALPRPPSIPSDVAANLFANPALVFHAVTAALALILGAFQFLRPKGRRAAWHRTFGTAYMGLCLASAPAGLILALGSTAGPIATAGFGLLAIVWFATTALGLKAVLDRRHQDHRRWMIRSYALTFAAVTLRLYMPLSPLMGVDPMDGYRAISFLCWVPNLMIAEMLLVGPRRITTTAPA